MIVVSRIPRPSGVIRQNIWASVGVKTLLALGVPFGLVNVAVAVGVAIWE
jgi:Cd2+/Zn2+-exporting ATPase